MTDVLDVLHAVADAAITEGEAVIRAAGLGNWGTAGGDPRWKDGLWLHPDCQHVPAHQGRIGGPIRPYIKGLHSTDMLPGEWDALIKRWREDPGDGACAHFLLGRSQTQGVVQMVPVDRNGNHMGGPGHGVFVLADGRQVHPNAVALGIEIHCAGGVRLVAGRWRLVEGGAAHGPPLPAEDVIPDSQRPGRGWHKVTDYQYAVLKELLFDMEQVLQPLPAGIKSLAFGEAVPVWAQLATMRVRTHVQMDPVHRADPWPPTCAWLRQNVDSAAKDTP